MIQLLTKCNLFREFSKLSNKFGLIDSHIRSIGRSSNSSLLRWKEGGCSISHQFSTLRNDDSDDHQMPWFPRHRSEIDLIIHRTINASSERSSRNSDDNNDDTTIDRTNDTLSSDHPGFHDPTYRARRTILAQHAQQYHWDHNHSIPYIDYTPSETQVWTDVYDRMIPLIQRHACSEYQTEFRLMQDAGIYTLDQIPQQSDIYQYLYNKTQFRLRPVAGLLQSRDFLNALAVRVFCSTQYIRHASQPYYTPEPDICHELLGHVPLLGNPVFANLSQQIGLASLGASDDDIMQLAKCYWHSVEFGLCLEHGIRKAYGAGLLSSFGELEYACGDSADKNRSRTGSDHVPPPKQPMYLRWDPHHAALQEFPITTYQSTYYVADSIVDALEQLKLFCDTTIEPKKPFTVAYNHITERIDVTWK